jgi:hypothetical protein
VVAAGPLAGHVVHLSADRRSAAISLNGRSVCAAPGSEIADPAREEASGWENFVCLTAQDAADLLHIVGQRWVLGSTGAIVERVHVGLGPGDHHLRIGPVILDLHRNLPFADAVRAPDGSLLAATVLVDGWKIERLHLYRPMVFLTAFHAPEYLRQAALCVASLLEFGGYDGAIHIITDQKRETILDSIPALDPARLSVQTIPAADWVGYVASKYIILEWPDAHTHQPLLFLDPDVMADADLTPMLAAIAASPRIMAPLESFSSLATNPSVGSSLIQRAGLSPHFACGFNGGTLGIPNLAEHAATLGLIRAILVNHVELHGRDSLRWVDQEIANYVSFAAANFDTATLLRHLRYGWEHAERDATRRIGLVHFFPPRGAMSKSEAMGIYTETLRRADAAAAGN